MELPANWKTTASGALMILTGVAGLFGVGGATADASLGLIVGGIGLVFAKDNK